MFTESDGIAPEMALQQILLAPGGVTLDRWKTLLLAHAIDKNNQIPHDKIAAWNDLGRFLDGQITAEDYYQPGNPVRKHVEATLATMGDKELEHYRSEINHLLCARIRESRGSGHWKSEAVIAGVRMYIDAARLCNADVIEDMEKWEKVRFPSRSRTNYEAELQEKIGDAFDEAMLSPSIQPENLSGFAVSVIKRRLIDFHRTRLGRHESSREKKLHFVSLDTPNYSGESRDINLHGMLEAEQFTASRHKVDAASLVNEMREYAQTLPEKDRMMLTAYLEEKTADPKVSNKKIAARVGMPESSFYMNIQRIMKHMAYADPVIHEFVRLHVLASGEHSSAIVEADDRADKTEKFTQMRKETGYAAKIRSAPKANRALE
jgi:DNA-directed RNA polymerase specialized sigma24 family protein